MSQFPIVNNLDKSVIDAIVNTDNHGYSQYIAQRERRKREQDEIKQVKEELNEIKTLLRELLSKENN